MYSYWFLLAFAFFAQNICFVDRIHKWVDAPQAVMNEQNELSHVKAPESLLIDSLTDREHSRRDFPIDSHRFARKTSLFFPSRNTLLNPHAEIFVPLREFPSLSAGGPQGLSQAHPQNSGQTAWASQRVSQPTPVQRPQQGPGNLSQQSNQAQENVQQTLDDAFFSASQYGGAQQGNDHSSTHLRTNSIDDFPPLGRGTHGDIGQDRRSSLAPTSGFGGFASNPSSAFGQHSGYIPSRASELGDAPGLERRAFPGRDGGFGVLL